MFMYSPQNIKLKQRPKQVTVNSSKGSTNTTLTQQTKAGRDPGPRPTLPLICHVTLSKLLNLPCTMWTILLMTEIGKTKKNNF